MTPVRDAGAGRARRKLHRTRTLLLGLAWLFPCAAAAEDEPAADSPTVSEIVFEGNKVTLPLVMRREMVIHEGDPADPEKIERSRQAIQDLGLFRRVRVEQTPTEKGARLTYVVEEKYYLLPYPRLSANADGQYGYGAEVRWNNVGGRNHSMRLLVSRAELKEDDRGVRTNFVGSYRAPFVFDTPYEIDTRLEHQIVPVTQTLTYDETFNTAELLVSRYYPENDGPASQGWSVGGGLLWQSEDRSGPGVPEPYGDAIAAVAQAAYRDLRFKVYSEEGTLAKVRLEAAAEGLGSDYSYAQFTTSYHTYLPVGERKYEGLEFGFDGGILVNGPGEEHPFKLGGSNQLHGYARGFLEGDAYYLFSAQYLRPLGRDWLRGGIVFEAGNAYSEPEGDADRVYTSLGFGLRARFTRFVNFEFEAGIAMPLEGGGARFYGGKV